MKKRKPIRSSTMANLNIARIQKALAEPTIYVPIGMSREDKRAFILSHSKKNNK